MSAERLRHLPSTLCLGDPLSSSYGSAFEHPRRTVSRSLSTSGPAQAVAATADPLGALTPLSRHQNPTRPSPALSTSAGHPPGATSPRVSPHRSPLGLGMLSTSAGRHPGVTSPRDSPRGSPCNVGIAAPDLSQGEHTGSLPDYTPATGLGPRQGDSQSSEVGSSPAASYQGNAAGDEAHEVVSTGRASSCDEEPLFERSSDDVALELEAAAASFSTWGSLQNPDAGTPRAQQNAGEITLANPANPGLAGGEVPGVLGVGESGAALEGVLVQGMEKPAAKASDDVARDRTVSGVALHAPGTTEEPEHYPQIVVPAVDVNPILGMEAQLFPSPEEQSLQDAASVETVFTYGPDALTRMPGEGTVACSETQIQDPPVCGDAQRTGAGTCEDPHRESDSAGAEGQRGELSEAAEGQVAGNQTGDGSPEKIGGGSSAKSASGWLPTWPRSAPPTAAALEGSAKGDAVPNQAPLPASVPPAVPQRVVSGWLPSWTTAAAPTDPGTVTDIDAEGREVARLGAETRTTWLPGWSSAAAPTDSSTPQDVVPEAREVPDVGPETRTRWLPTWSTAVTAIESPAERNSGGSVGVEAPKAEEAASTGGDVGINEENGPTTAKPEAKPAASGWLPSLPGASLLMRVSSTAKDAGPPPPEGDLNRSTSPVDGLADPQSLNGNTIAGSGRSGETAVGAAPTAAGSAGWFPSLPGGGLFTRSASKAESPVGSATGEVPDPATDGEPPDVKAVPADDDTHGMPNTAGVANTPEEPGAADVANAIAGLDTADMAHAPGEPGIADVAQPPAGTDTADVAQLPVEANTADVAHPSPPRPSSAGWLPSLWGARPAPRSPTEAGTPEGPAPSDGEPPAGPEPLESPSGAGLTPCSAPEVVEVPKSYAAGDGGAPDRPESPSSESPSELEGARAGSQADIADVTSLPEAGAVQSSLADGNLPHTASEADTPEGPVGKEGGHCEAGISIPPAELDADVAVNATAGGSPGGPDGGAGVVNAEVKAGGVGLGLVGLSPGGGLPNLVAGMKIPSLPGGTTLLPSVTGWLPGFPGKAPDPKLHSFHRIDDF
jgi:hypothetical protein